MKPCSRPGSVSPSTRVPRPFCREVVTDRRVVDEGRIVTAGGVSSSLDLGLYLVEKYWGAEARKTIAAQMAYRAYSAA